MKNNKKFDSQIKSLMKKIATLPKLPDKPPAELNKNSNYFLDFFYDLLWRQAKEFGKCRQDSPSGEPLLA